MLPTKKGGARGERMSLNLLWDGCRQDLRNERNLDPFPSLSSMHGRLRRSFLLLYQSTLHYYYFTSSCTQGVGIGSSVCYCKDVRIPGSVFHWYLYFYAGARISAAYAVAV